MLSAVANSKRAVGAAALIGSEFFEISRLFPYNRHVHLYSPLCAFVINDNEADTMSSPFSKFQDSLLVKWGSIPG